ncbi:ABC transporter substrate-binding protein [Xanthobacter sp. DSM 24535]|uniref:heme/hemin ABC transporter substrate-binding protein n=1 Tax=Roseixanthobacter psychrophilus TaxID=3119917 RepID=UPI003727DEB6
MAILFICGLAPAATEDGRPAQDTSRIVSIGGAVTETLFALGLGNKVIAVDQTSTYPAAAGALPNVGYARTLTPEGVLSVGPSLILAIEGSGPPETLAVLKSASVPVVMIPEGHDAEGVIRKVEAVAGAVGATEAGARLVAALKADFAQVAGDVARLENRPRAAFVLSAASGTAVVGGAGTSADAMLRLAGAENAMSGITGYKPAVDEAAFAADPQAVVVMSGAGQVLTAPMIFALPAFKGTTAARDDRFVALPGSYLLGFGPRTPQAVRDLALALRPGETLPSLPPRSWAQEAMP